MSVRTDLAGGGLVVVAGGGTMGSGIAQVFLEIDCQVQLLERDDDSAGKATERVRGGLTRRFAGADDRQALVDGRMARLRVVTAVDTGASPDLVIESVYESYDAKLEVLKNLSQAYADVPLVSNTSALSLSRLSAAVQDPSRFLGMHFFNPVPRSALVELVVVDATQRSIVDLCGRWVTHLSKEHIVVRDTPGFATSRLGMAVGLEAIRMVEEGVASVEDIDKGAVLGYRFPVGPLELSDIVGLDVRLAIADNLSGELGPRFAAPQILRQMVSEGSLGRKTGRGFYRWSDGKKVDEPKQSR